MKKRVADFGSVISGTMRPEDLIPAFCAELRNLGHRSIYLSRIERHIRKTDSGMGYWGTDKYWNSNDAQWDLEDLFEMLEGYSPEWAYFGSHPGDGSDYGFWLGEIEYDFDGLKVQDLSEIPGDYTGEILLINDHGNLTLFNRGLNHHLYEIWSVV